jgi:hypothetical protein
MIRFEDECVGCERMERALDRELAEVERLRRVKDDQEREIEDLHRRVDDASDRVDRAQGVTFDLMEHLSHIQRQITAILAHDKVRDDMRRVREHTVEAGSWTP